VDQVLGTAGHNLNEEDPGWVTRDPSRGERDQAELPNVNAMVMIVGPLSRSRFQPQGGRDLATCCHLEVRRSEATEVAVLAEEPDARTRRTGVGAGLGPVPKVGDGDGRARPTVGGLVAR
jgi:hypothetical protein